MSWCWPVRHSSFVIRDCASVLLALALVTVGQGTARAGRLEKEFRSPPASARPWVYWFWLNGNITSNGISADLEAMQRAGIGGVLIMEVDQGTPQGSVVFGSPEWRSLFQFVCAEATRLGLQVRMSNDAGWCGSGGPWITPELSMQMVVWSEEIVRGPGSFSNVLELPRSNENFYRDIAVLAFPTPAGDEVKMALLAPTLSASAGAERLVPGRLLNGDPDHTITLPPPTPGHPCYVQLEFAEPFKVRQMRLRMAVSGDQICHGILQASDDGQVFWSVREFDAEPVTTVFNFPEVRARYFRVLFEKPNPDFKEFVISELEFSPRFRIDFIEAKALFLRKYTYPGPNRFAVQAEYPPSPPGVAIGRNMVVNLTEQMTQDGRLKWEVPTGSWTILRIGHTSTGKDNHPAPETGRGLECDKLNKTAVEVVFNGLISKLAGDNRRLVPSTFTSTHIDSWEVGCQNWTATFRRDFERLRGYDPLVFLPVITGRVVDGLDTSERFLWDLRQTVSDLLIENYAGHLKQLANARRLGLSVEAYDGNPCDDLTYAGRADEPMAEFWTWPPYEVAYSCTAMASAAHVYGKSIVGAEAFTATDAEKWLGHPFLVKVYGDWAFCEGINRFIVHRYALQPWTNPDRMPGVSMGPWGLHYERTQTWWEDSKAWHAYLARCQYLLQQGLFSADICYLASENVPEHWKPPGESLERPGHNFDACPPEVLMNNMTVKKGRLVLPHGMNYRVLALPDGDTMTPRLLSRIKKLVEVGATVIGRPPLKSPSLRGYPASDVEVASLVKELWGDCDGKTVTEHRVGQGRVVWGQTPEQVLARSGVPADFAAETKSGRASLRYIHKTLPGREVYFMANRTLEPEEAVCEFRVEESIPELWWPDTGRVEKPAMYEQRGKVLRLPIRLEPAGSVFVLFRPERAAGMKQIVSVMRNGEAANDLSDRVGKPRFGNQVPNATNTFTMAVWVKPEAATVLHEETNFGKSGVLGERNEALYPPPAHEIFHSPDHSGIGLTAGTNGVCVTEHSAHYWGSLLVHAAPLTNWTHVAVVFQNGRPRLYLNGKLTREGIQSLCTVHCGVGVPHRRGVAPFHGWLGDFYSVGRALSEPEIEELQKRMAVPATVPGRPLINLTEAPGGTVEAEVWQSGAYEARSRAGGTWRFAVSELPKPLHIAGAWELRLLSRAGGAGGLNHATITLDRLISWSEHLDEKVRHFSGTASYQKTFVIPDGWLGRRRRAYLDLGKVAIMAGVRVNGKSLGSLWKPPFCVDITDAARPGENVLEVDVTNLWVNRMIGDEDLPEDSERNENGSLKAWPQWLREGKVSPTGRQTFTTWRLWKKGTPLQISGLLGPVTVVASEQVSTKKIAR
jgi:hypothetical protein